MSWRQVLGDVLLGFLPLDPLPPLLQTLGAVLRRCGAGPVLTARCTQLILFPHFCKLWGLRSEDAGLVQSSLRAAPGHLFDFALKPSLAFCSSFEE